MPREDWVVEAVVADDSAAAVGYWSEYAYWCRPVNVGEEGGWVVDVTVVVAVAVVFVVAVVCAAAVASAVAAAVAADVVVTADPG